MPQGGHAPGSLGGNKRLAPVNPQPHTEHGANIRGPVESGGYRQPYRQSNPSGTRNVLRRSPGPPRGSTGTGPSGRRVFHTKAGWQAIRKANARQKSPAVNALHALTGLTGIHPSAIAQALLNPKAASAAGETLRQASEVGKGLIAEERRALAMRPRNVGKTKYTGIESVPGDVLGAAKKAPGAVGDFLKQSQIIGFGNTPPQLRTLNTGGQNPPGKSKVLGTSEQKQSSLAPGLQVLNLSTTPIHALAGAETKFLKSGGSVSQAAKGFGEGLGGKQYNTQDVLGAAGVPKGTLRTVLGTAGDIFLDPTTYVGFGLNVPRKAAMEAAQAAAKQASARTLAQHGITDAAQKIPQHVAERAAQAGRMAGERAARRAGGTSKRAAVSFAGHEVPGSTAAAKAVVKPVRAVLRPATGSKPGVAARAFTRDTISDVSPRTAPAGIPKVAYQGARTGARQARGEQRNAVRVADARVAAARRLIPAEHRSAVQDALERADLSGLPDHLVRPRVVKGQSVPGPAVQLRDAFRGLDRARKQAGIPGGSITPRTRAISIKKAEAAHGAAVRPVGEALNGARVEHARNRLVSAVADLHEARRAGNGVAAAENGVAHATADLHNANRLAQVREPEHPATIAALARKVEAAKARPKGYTAHIAVKDEEAPPRGGVGSGKPRPPASKSRGSGLNLPLSTLRETHPGLFSEDPALGIGERTVESGTAVAKAHLNQNLMRAIGRPIPRPRAPLGSHVPRGTLEPRAFRLKAGETIYRLKGSDLQELNSGQLARLLEKPGGGQLFAADKAAVDHMRAPFLRGERKGIARAYDAAQSGFKRVATFTPGFNIRNLVGDTQMGAFNPQGGGTRFFASYPKAYKAVKAISKQEAAARKGGGIGRLAPKAKEGEKPTAAQFAQEAAEQGVPRSGYVGRELQDLSRPGREMDAATAEAGKKVKLRKRPVSSVYNRWSANREDLARMATYITARKRGLNPEEAANEVADTHIDYGDLSEIERKVFRRIAPFYTFSARNIPFEARTLLQKPGRVAAFQKIRENAQQQSGLPPDYEKLLQEYDQRQMGLPVGGHNVSMSLPAIDLNELPVSTNPGELLNEWFNRAMTLPSPYLKDPIELKTNFSFFFRRAIENDNSPLKAAPAWVQYLPDDIKKAAHVVGPDDPHPFRDPQSGKPTWAWRGKADYIAGQLQPGLLQLFKQLAVSSNPGGGSGVGNLGVLTGARSTPLNKKTYQQTKKNQEFQSLHDLTNRQHELNQRGINASNPTAEYQRLRGKIKKLQQQTGSGPKKTLRRRGSGIPGQGGGGLRVPGTGGGGLKVPGT